MKSSKKELSWGSVKAGEAKAQDIVFKNVSAAKKLRLIISVIGEGFRVSIIFMKMFIYSNFLYLLVNIRLFLTTEQTHH